MPSLPNILDSGKNKQRLTAWPILLGQALRRAEDAASGMPAKLPRLAHNSRLVGSLALAAYLEHTYRSTSGRAIVYQPLPNAKAKPPTIIPAR